MKSTITNKDAICTNCLTNLDMATSVEGSEVPGVGDISICYICKVIAWFDAGMNLIPLTDEELMELEHDAPDLYHKLMYIVNELDRMEIEKENKKI